MSQEAGMIMPFLSLHRNVPDFIGICLLNYCTKKSLSRQQKENKMRKNKIKP
jgi:hypothetical protein